MQELDRGIRLKRNILIALGSVCILLFLFYMLLEEFAITNVIVEGNKHYTAAEIRRIVENGWFGDNSLILSLKYSHREVDSIPFVETMDVKVEDRHTVRVTVYEKSLAGYLYYLDRYMYFDKDGILVESADVPTFGLPLVTGLKFDSLVMYEALPVEDPSVFQTILEVTKILNKYELVADKIHFSEDNDITIYFNKLRVQLGQDDLIEEKIQQLSANMDDLKGKSGVFDLRNYEGGDDVWIPFMEDM